jgi:amino acid adenylation domain-containing protein
VTGEFNALAEIQCYLPRDGGATLYKLFEAQVALRPEAVALTCEGNSLTYGQLNALANRLARHLVQFDVQADTLVGLFLDRSNELVIAILAILKAGGAYVPIDLAYPAHRVAFMLEDARVPVLLTQRKLAGNLPSTLAKVLCVEEVLARPVQTGEEANLPAVAGPDHLAYVIYTSGTTGKPKGSLITHRNVARLFSATEHWYEFDERDVWTLFHSCAFDFSVWEVWGALLYGGRAVVVPFLVSRSPEAFYELLAREKVTVLNQTPSAFRQLIQAEESAGPRELALRYVIFGGEALEMQSLRPWFERHGDEQPRLVNMYGITETTVHVTYRPLSKNDLDSGSVIGVPIPDLQIYILDPQGRPVPTGVSGEIYVGGAGLARGYLRRPELTAEQFIPNQLTGQPGSCLYKTGDLARFLPGHDIEYLGRIDGQVKIRGFRIELGEIESVLRQHAAVRETAVIVREDAPFAKRLVAYVVIPPGQASRSDELREFLARKLPDYMIPTDFVRMPALPLTANGKLDRTALPIPTRENALDAIAYRAPQSPIEIQVASIVSQLLALDRVGREDNFFLMGLHSLLSAMLIMRLRDRFGVQLTLRDLFETQTLAKLAERVERELISNLKQMSEEEAIRILSMLERA